MPNCSKCQKYISTNSSLAVHEKYCDGTGTKKDRVIKRFICPICNYRIFASYKKHLVSCDGIGPKRIRRKLSRNKEKKPWNKGLTKETDERVMKNSIGVRRWIINNPNKHIIRNMGFGFYSLPQLELQSIVEGFVGYKNVHSEYYVRTDKTYRYIDVAWVKEKIGFEYDGFLHSFDKDLKRNIELANVGWNIYHFDKDDFSNDRIINKIADVVERRKHQNQML